MHFLRGDKSSTPGIQRLRRQRSWPTTEDADRSGPTPVSSLRVKKGDRDRREIDGRQDIPMCLEKAPEPFALCKNSLGNRLRNLRNYP